jgi:O-antigen/teichoic acid export membrane protein
LLLTTAPLGVAMLLISLNANVPRYFLQHYDGAVVVGLFVALAYIGVPGSVLVNALAQAALPRLARHHAEGDTRSYLRTLLALAGTSAGLGVALVAAAFGAGAWILRAFYGADYAAAAGALPILMVASAVFYVASVVGYGTSAARRFQSQAWVVGAAVVTNLLVCVWAIPSQGLYGAALAFLAGALVQALGGACVVYRALPQSPAHC